MRLLLFITGICFGLAGAAQFTNIKLSDKPDGRYTPVEPSITINRKNTQNIAAGIGVRRMMVTQDGGKTWSDSLLTSPYGVFGDPAMISDVKGNLYYFHLADPSGKGRSNDAWLDRMVMQKSGDQGKTWTTGTSIGNNPPKDQDKEWPAVHPTKPYVYLTWTQFDKYALKDTSCHSNILFSMSKNEGDQWTAPVQINQFPGDCIDDDNTTEGAVPAVDADGNVYVSWSNQGNIYFDRSMDGGTTWLENDIVVAKHAGGWSMDIPGINRCNGMPVLMMDNSRKENNGNLYIVWADQKNGIDDTDIWFTKWTDKGTSWSAPMRINQDGPGKHQFLPWLAVDQATGYLYVVYYDRRAYNDLQTDVYIAWSTNGGASFTETKISKQPFTPVATKFFGDYNNIAAHKGIIAPIWTRMDNEVTSVWTSIIKEADLIKK